MHPSPVLALPLGSHTGHPQSRGWRERILGPSCPPPPASCWPSFLGLGWKTRSKHTFLSAESYTRVGSPYPCAPETHGPGGPWFRCVGPSPYSGSC